MFISHVESVKAVKSSIYSDAAIPFPGSLLLVVFGVSTYLESALWPSNGDLLLIIEPCFTVKMCMTITAFA